MKERRSKTPKGSHVHKRCVKIRIKDEKSLPVVPSSWEEGLGMVEKNNDITYYKSNIYKMVEPFFVSTTPDPSIQKEGTTN